MANHYRDAVVGVFVLVLGAALIWGILWISTGGPQKRFDNYVTYMNESVSGLYVDAPLTYQGVDVGKVEAIQIDANNPRRVKLLLQVEQGTPITTATIATLEYQGLTGIASVNLVGGPDAPALVAAPGTPFPEISSQPSLYARLEDNAIELLDHLARTAEVLDSLLNDSNRASISATLDHVAVIAENVAGQSHRLETLVSRLDRILEHVEAASGDLPEVMAQFDASTRAVSRMATSIRGVADNLDAATADIARTASASGRNLRQFTGNTLPEVSAMVAELKLASENLRQASDILARNPGAILFGVQPPKRGPGE